MRGRRSAIGLALACTVACIPDRRPPSPPPPPVPQPPPRTEPPVIAIDPNEVIEFPRHAGPLGLPLGRGGWLKPGEVTSIGETTWVVGSMASSGRVLPESPRVATDGVSRGFVLRLEGDERQVLLPASPVGPYHHIHAIAGWSDGVVVGGTHGNTGWVSQLTDDGDARWARALNDGARPAWVSDIVAGRDHAFVLVEEARGPKVDDGIDCRVEVIDREGTSVHAWHLAGGTYCRCSAGALVDDDVVIVGHVAGQAPWIDPQGSGDEARRAFVARFGRDGRQRWVPTVANGRSVHATDVIANADGIVTLGQATGPLTGPRNEELLGTGVEQGVWVVRWSGEGEAQDEIGLHASDAVLASKLTETTDGIWLGGSYQGHLEVAAQKGPRAYVPTAFLARLDAQLRLRTFITWPGHGRGTRLHGVTATPTGVIRVLGDRDPEAGEKWPACFLGEP